MVVDEAAEFQLDMFDRTAGYGSLPGDFTRFDCPEVNLGTYDNIIVCMSGGKDSIACLLRLFDMGVDRRRIELWHHDVDGREGSTLMDWPFMADYVRQIGLTFDLPVYFSWLEGGFEGEMLKQDAYSRPHHVETPDGLVILERDTSRMKLASRMRFPQQAADLRTRWCSSALKIDVGRRALTAQSRFNGKRVLFVTGERRQESANRARYNQLEPHACDRRTGRTGRYIDAWRPVLHWTEEQVWDAFRRHSVLPPVPYRLGWGRSSCMTCIFNDATIWATIGRYFPARTQAIADHEIAFGVSISRSGKNVLELAAIGTPMTIVDMDALEQAVMTEYVLPVLCGSDEWIMPPGAMRGAACGAP